MAFLSAMAAPILVAMASSCPTPPPTAITVRPVSQDPEINNTKSRYILEDFDISTVSPYAHDEYTEVNGLMRGKVEIETNVSVSWRTNQATGKGCFWYKNIDVVIELAPTIYIAEEIRPKTCMYDEVLNHEFKHVNVDRDLANKYVTLFKQNLHNFTRQNVQNMPQPAYQAKQIKDQMVTKLDEVITRLNDQMQQERLQKQAAVDTLSEYERVANACVSRY